jgi:hypothetical protein
MQSVQAGFGPPVKDLIPPTGFLPAYLRAALNLSPAPPIYHVAAASAILSAIVCPYTKLVRTVGGKEQRAPLHMWMFLAGPPNNGKSYSIKQARSLAKPFLRGRFMAPIGSLQGLEQAFRKIQNPFLYLGEAARFLSENRAVWMRGNGAQFWCEVFDGELSERSLQRDEKRKRNRDDDDVEVDDDGKVTFRPAKAPADQPTGPTFVNVTMLGAAATGSLLRALKPSDWEGGMMSRVMFVSAGSVEDDDNWFDWPDPIRTKLEGLLRGVEEFCQLHPSITFEPDAYEVWRGWFKGSQAATRGLGSVHAEALARLSRHVRVLCAINAASSLSATISIPMVRAAVALGDYSRLCTLGLPIA